MPESSFPLIGVLVSRFGVAVERHEAIVLVSWLSFLPFQHQALTSVCNYKLDYMLSQQTSRRALTLLPCHFSSQLFLYVLSLPSLPVCSLHGHDSCVITLLSPHRIVIAIPSWSFLSCPLFYFHCGDRWLLK